MIAEDNVLVPIRTLINGTTIRRQRDDAVTYFHVELDRHDIILAEGMPVETYLDTGNRGAFLESAVIALWPEIGRAAWDRHACRPLQLEGPALENARSRLHDRALALGHHTRDDADIHLIADGHRIDPRPTDDGLAFDLPPACQAIRLHSRALIPADHGLPSHDPRRLGIAVARLTVDGETLPPGDPRRTAGWHPPEPNWQWTDGESTIAVPGARRIELALGPQLTYWASVPLRQNASPVKASR